MIAVESYYDWPSFAIGVLVLILVLGWTIQAFVRPSGSPSRRRSRRQAAPEPTTPPLPKAPPADACREELETAESVAVRQLLTGQMDSAAYRARMHELAFAAGSTPGPHETTET